MSKQSDFIDKVAPVIVKVAKERGYAFPSAIIAQSILESGWGESKLAKYYNFFGMKCGSKWTGKSVDMHTDEQKTNGQYYTITANFRAYDSLEEGINGYFDFINTSRYANLRNATSPRDYLQRIKNDGYATSLKYVDNNMRVVNTYNLTKFDTGEVVQPKEQDTELPPDLAQATDVFANYVIAGMLGNGEERKERIYKIIQRRVNERC